MAAQYSTPGAANLEALSDYATFVAGPTFTGPVRLPVYTVATLPVSAPAGALAYCSNGNAGAATLVAGNGTNWKVVDLGATASAT